jgi:hypothetical protein
MYDAGLRYCLTRVACSYKEQVALYSQGRDSLYIVNHYRWLVGLPPIHDPENRIITWTLKSLHIVDIEDQDPDNDKARAFDFAITRDGKPIWDIKVDTNQSAGPDYDEAGHLWEACGGVWGGRWKNPDRPHCQL